MRLIAKQIAEALEAAHEAGVIHRDLGERFLTARAVGTQTGGEDPFTGLIVVENWFEELKARVPVPHSARDSGGPIHDFVDISPGGCIHPATLVDFGSIVQQPTLTTPSDQMSVR